MKQALYGLIGERLGHSFSQRYFSKKFANEGIAAEYRLFELADVNELMELVAEYPTLAGLNVTIPFKQYVIPFLDSIEPTAAAAGAVNTIRIVHTGDDVRLEGFNTDIVGFGLMLPDRKFNKALILGTGGASKGVQYVLSQRGIDYEVISRSAGKGSMTYKEITTEIMSDVDLIVNATPLGTTPDVDSKPDLPYNLIKPSTLCLDLVYNPAITAFMSRCAEQGATVKNGLEMLTGQAEASWMIWTR